jgi:acetyl esterase/lipase
MTPAGRHRPVRVRRAALVVCLVLAVPAVVTGCGSSRAATRPVGTPSKPAAAPAPRYRQPVFPTVSVTRNLRYGGAAGRDGKPVVLALDLYQPAGDPLAKRPAVVWVHGGGYREGDKASGPAPALASLFAKLGYVAVSINYRLLAPQPCAAAAAVTNTCYAAAVEAVHDAQAAVRWLRARAGTYRIDPNRIGIGGESAGAITAAGVGVHSDEPGASGNPGYPSTVRAWVSISGGLPGGVFVDRTDAPGLLFHGTADFIVPYRYSAETATAMRRAGVPVELETLDRAGHVPWTEYRDAFAGRSESFLYTYLDLAHAAR